MTSIGVCFPREFPAADLVPAARAIEAAGAEELWIIEDCFFTAGMSLAGAAMASTERINIALGILPAVARNPAITAMEIATLAGLGPGRVIGGIGHGVQEWMEQIGARTHSPLTTLSEVLDAVRALLRGEAVNVEGREVRLRDVRLESPPSPVPPVLAGVQGPKSLAMAGKHADGVVLADWTGPTFTRWARAQTGAEDGFQVAVFAMTCLDSDRGAARARTAPLIVEAVGYGAAGLRRLPFYDELVAAVATRGVEAVMTASEEWWLEFGAIGTPDDALAHIAALGDAGADRVAIFFPPDRELWDGQLELLAREVLPALTP